MIRLEKGIILLYLLTITIIGLFFVFKNTPLTGLDERFHFFRAYQISQGGMLPKQINNEKGAWGGCVNDKALAYVWPFFISQDKNEPASREAARRRAAELDGSKNDHNTCFNFAPSATYSPLLYFPSAIGIASARLTGMGIDTQMYAGRLLNLVFFVGMIYIAVMMMPVMRIPTLMVLSFPTLINLASSYSPDPVTNLITVMFIACCLRMAILKERILLITFVMACLIGLLKMTNIAFLPFLALIPASLFSSKVKWLGYISGSIIAGCAVALAWNGHYSWVPSEFWHSGGDINAAKSRLISDPLGTTLFILKSVWIQTPDMFNKMFATFGGGPQLFTWTYGGPFCRSAIMLAGLASIISVTKSRLDFGWFRLALLPVMSIGSIALIFLALWVGFSRLDLGIVAGVQGRYFIISLMVMMLFIVLSLSSSSRIVNSSIMNAATDGRLMLVTAFMYIALISYVSFLSIQTYLPLYV